MKKFLILLISVLYISCNNGDLDIPAFDFEEEVSTCGTYVLYRTNDDDTEAIVLTLSSTDLTAEIGEDTYEIGSSRDIIYRVFDDGISSSYFCQDIPPTTPNVLKELTAESGTLTITTTEGDDEDSENDYIFTFTVTDLVFTDGDSEIKFESFDFGEISGTFE